MNGFMTTFCKYFWELGVESVDEEGSPFHGWNTECFKLFEFVDPKPGVTLHASYMGTEKSVESHVLMSTYRDTGSGNWSKDASTTSTPTVLLDALGNAS